MSAAAPGVGIRVPETTMLSRRLLPSDEVVLPPVKVRRMVASATPSRRAVLKE